MSWTPGIRSNGNVLTLRSFEAPESAAALDDGRGAELPPQCRAIFEADVNDSVYGQVLPQVNLGGHAVTESELDGVHVGRPLLEYVAGLLEGT